MQPFSVEPVTLIEEVSPRTPTLRHAVRRTVALLMDKAGGIACAKFAHRSVSSRYPDLIAQPIKATTTGQVASTSNHRLCQGHAQSMSKSDWERRLICEGYFRRHRLQGAPSRFLN